MAKPKTDSEKILAALKDLNTRVEDLFILQAPPRSKKELCPWPRIAVKGRATPTTFWRLKAEKVGSLPSFFAVHIPLTSSSRICIGA